ncbi:MAG: class I SAM-dependent methyltransferase [Ferruginibacter sp.]
MIHYSKCPVCASEAVHEQLKAVDHTVSRETFAVWHCNSCSLRFTQDIPAADAIGPYYASDAYVSHSDTKEGLVNSLYHRVRKITLQAKRKLVARSTGISKGRILDIGCGTGAFLAAMQKAGWEITGLEPDATARAKALELYRIEAAEPAELDRLPAGSFDAITMWHVLEHVHELHHYADQLARLLRPHGKIFIAVPNYTSYDAGLYKENWAAYDVPRHLYHFSPASMEKLLRLYGFKLLRCKPMWFDSIYVSMLSEQYKNGKSSFISACWNGFISNLNAIGNPKKCSSVIYVVEKEGALLTDHG